MSLRQAILFALLGAGCSQQPPQQAFASLESSGAVSFLCLNQDFEPRTLEDCRGVIPEDDARRTVSMVTQTTRGEVAVVDYALRSPVDVEPTVPGTGFLPVGAAPVDIVSTPGSVATFVGVGEVGKEGIFALPTTCISPRVQDGGSPLRDLTVWPACRLPTTPGDMAIIIEPPDASGDVRSSCDGLLPDDGDAGDPASRECPADLSQETSPPGRRKLLVSLPEWGEVAVIDAQWLLDRPEGSFEPCEFDRRLELDVRVPPGGVAQRPPDDLDVAGCALPGFNHGPVGPVGGSRPAGFAVMDDLSTVYVADEEAPVIHVLDTSRACEIAEREPLLPVSFTDPNRVVTTKKVAVSPLTRRGGRFLYAIDEADAGSVMIFDVSEDSTDRTPIVRRRSKQFPYEPPDRISFAAPAKDVAFGFRDVALEGLPLGVSPDGILCDPNPSLSSDDPGARRRTSADYSRGAAPWELRGIFGFLALSTGQIAVVDVEDWDAPCRRPIFTNTSSVEDFRGCAGDPTDGFYTENPADPEATPTVSAEVSCQVVEPHRWRSSTFLIDDQNYGVRAPALRALPQLTSGVGRRLPTDQTEQGRPSPKMLAVDFSPRDPAQVYVGSTLRRRDDVSDPLVVDPATAEESSLVLSFAEPRLYPSSENFTATYEGGIVLNQPSARLGRGQSGSGAPISLTDSGIVYCDHGVEDESLTARTAQDIGVVESDVPRFVQDHTDYVVVTSAFLDEDHPYWRTEQGGSCGGTSPDQPGASRAACRRWLGTPQNPVDTRELAVVHASRSELELRVRDSERKYSARDEAFIVDLLLCCFPEPVTYDIRASHEWVVIGSSIGFRHRITTGPDGSCIRDCNPLRELSNGRAFEISCDADACPLGADENPVIGLGTDRDVACVTGDPSQVHAQRAPPGRGCVFSNATTSFAIYRGLEPSERGMTFAWNVVGGFSSLITDLRIQDGPDTVPVSMTFAPHVGALAVTDGATKGLSFIYLSNFGGSVLRIR